MFFPVGNDQPGYMMGQVVQPDLFKYAAGDGDRRSFAFDEYHRITHLVVHKDVGPFLHSIKTELLLNRNQRRRISFFLYQVLYEVLPYPLLGA